MNRFFALVLALVAGSATGAGVYDGIYQVEGSQEYYSVHQNGSRIVVGAYYVFPRSILAISSPLGGFAPPQSNLWDVLGGTFSSANAAQLSGEFGFGECNAVVDVVFDTAKATFTFRSLTNTAAATAQGISCALVLETVKALNGGSARYQATRIF